ncbi:hypothetical protein SAMN05443633_104332 [Chryseobacterium arachidis]|uniref:Uncharacterized protein n=1 Tax=Chryseobacterium arachidis TaxID=1416778 RepID=A0A1M5BY50_9FLAO|nr:hypothetical protein [Chryseobacterium arachidis]SHF47336.1 hypothetical protein SAMN05443633_104332 [Chryseobacterium arachidis]
MGESTNCIQNKEIHVEFFLKKRDIVIDDLKNISQNWKSYFLRFNELTESELMKYLSDDDFYIEGAVRITYFGKELIGFRYWDLIDQLCSYFIHAIYEITIDNKKSVKFYFPDQPVEVFVTKEKELVGIKIGNKDIFYLNRNIFMKEFSNACKNLYERINISSYELEMEEIEEILKYLR